MSSTSISISGLLRETEQRFFGAGIPTSRLDAEVLLAHVLGVTRPYLHAHGKDELGSKEVRKLASYIKRRLKREPVAYITGEKEFYGRKFMVTPNVLIPRPETEGLVELTLELVDSRQSTAGRENTESEPHTTSAIHLQPESALLRTQGRPGVKPWSESMYAANDSKWKVLDVGCGSGCIGITLKIERPELDVMLCDISPKALNVARKNAEQLGADVQFANSNLLSNFLTSPLPTFDLIVANLPYVNTTWKTSPETAYEPSLALYAEDNGLKLIKKLIKQSTEVLNNQGLLLLEADPEQHSAVIEAAVSCGFKLVETRGYALAFTKLTPA